MDKEKHREYHRNKWNERREDRIRKLGCCCCECASIENLQFDHKDPTKKKFSFNRILNSRPTQEIDAEWENCQLLCEKCHLEKTIAEKKPFEHGNWYSVIRKKCQCEKCCEFRRFYYDKRNKNRRSSAGKGAYNLPAECGTPKKYKRGCFGFQTE